MSYDEIMLLTDIQTRNDKLKEFYINKINVNDWFVDKTKYKKISFKDRIEYYKFNKLHNIIGPAINFDDSQKDLYYIDGVRMEKDEWTKESTLKLRKIKINTLLKKS
jgi:hypothetical protein